MAYKSLHLDIKAFCRPFNCEVVVNVHSSCIQNAISPFRTTKITDLKPHLFSIVQAICLLKEILTVAALRETQILTHDIFAKGENLLLSFVVLYVIIFFYLGNSKPKGI